MDVKVINSMSCLFSDSPGSLSDSLCVGDFICLYCVDTGGYVFSTQSGQVSICLLELKSRDSNYWFRIVT